MADRPTSGPNDYLAAERTFLAWIRTGLAPMGFGFVVARFGLFLQALQAGQSQLARPCGPSFWFGTALIVLGVVVNQICARSQVRLVRELNRGGSAFNRPSTLAIAVAVILASLGLAMAVYLVSVREPLRENAAGKNQEVSMTPIPDNGIVTIESSQSVDRTVRKLEQILEAKGVKLFALVDHGGEAEKVGMKMPPTRLLIFGNPKAGTPLMLAAPGIAIDLPLKILVAEDAGGKVRISFNSPAWLAARHRLSGDLVRNIAVVEALARQAAE